MAIYWDFYEIDGKDYKALCEYVIKLKKKEK